MKTASNSAKAGSLGLGLGLQAHSQTQQVKYYHQSLLVTMQVMQFVPSYSLVMSNVASRVFLGFRVTAKLLRYNEQYLHIVQLREHIQPKCFIQAVANY